MHHLMAVDLQGFADVSDFISKAHLERVEAIANILNHLCGLQRCDKNGCVDSCVKTPDRSYCFFIVGANESERRGVEILQ